MDITAQRQRRGLSADMLKIIAIVAMTIDHAAATFVPVYYSLPGAIMHCIGRITGPVMFYFIVEGYHHTRNANRYTLRLGLFALVSYLPFIYFKSGALPTADTWLDLNVIYTLFLGHLMLRVRHEVRHPVPKYLVVAGLFLLSFYGDWGYLALLFIWVFDTFRGNFKQQAVGYGALALMRLLPAVDSLWTQLSNKQPAALWQPYAGQVLVMAGMFLPLLLLAFYSGQKGGLGRGGKWLFYIYYPLHLLVLGYLRFAI